ncbi:MAG: Ig-like domain-containing protein, partial [Opitutaceae bacterium]|nr:Ig-like domain-containing protein [Verrucomicrobiales bacterium]
MTCQPTQIFFALTLLGLAQGQVPAVPDAIPNVAQVPGKLLFRSSATQQRITNIAYHNGSFYTNMVTGAARKVWRFNNPASVASFAQDTTRSDNNIPLFNDQGNHGHSKSGAYLGGGFAMDIKRQSTGVNVTQPYPDYQTFTHYELGGHALYWPWRLPFHWIQYGGLDSPTPTRIIRPGTTGPQTLFEWNSLAEDGVTGNSILLGNLLFVTSDESSLGILCYDIAPVFKNPPERPVLLDKLTGDFGAYIAVPFEHYIVLARNAENKVEVIDFSDPTDLRHVASIDVTGHPSWAGDVNVPYTQAQDNFIFTRRHKIDMDSFTPVLEFDQAGNNRPVGSVSGIVDTSQYMKPIGNLLVTGGYSFEQSDRLAIWAHQAEPDTRRPYVGYHVPRPGQTNFPLGAPISLLIHEALESYTIINGVTIILREVGTTTPLDCWTSFAHDGVLTLTPKVYLNPDRSYEVILTDGGIKDALNNGIEPYAFSFSTGAGAAGGNASPGIGTFSASPSPAAPGLPVSFTAIATDPENDPLQYRINYGDGSPTTVWGSSAGFSQSYAEPGHYVVKLQVRDQKPGGAVSVVSKDLTITIATAPAGPAATNSSTLALDAANRRVWCANPDADTVSTLNADTNLKTAEFNLNSLLAEPGSIDPRNIALDSSGNAWVTCHDADCVAVLSPAGALLARINTGYGSAP